MVLGWIKLYRSLLNSQIWVTKEPYDKRSAWIYLLLRASHEDKVIEFKGETVNLKSGTLIDTYRHFSDTWMWSLARVQRYIEKLKSIQMINAERYKGGTLITIVNWEFYQGLENGTDTLTDTHTDTNFFENRYSFLTKPIRSPIQDTTKTDTLTDKERKEERKEAKERSKERNTIQENNIYSASETVPEPTAGEAESLFEELWKAYPQKRGKGSISITTKKKLLKIGREHMLRAIDRYVRECEAEGRYFKNGSTFFNSGYIDYLDENFKPLTAQPDKNTKRNAMINHSRDSVNYDELVAQQLFFKDFEGDAETGGHD